VKYLNFVIHQINNESKDYISLRSEGLFGLRLLHGAGYISYLSLIAAEGELDDQYVLRIERYLIQFYMWLKKQGIIDELFDYEECDKSPFDDIELGTIYPKKQKKPSNKLVDFGDNRLELVLKFIKIAEQIAPDIMLGITFQFFGGLRLGEVVNLTKRSLENPNYFSENTGRQQFILQVRDNQTLLFGHRKTSIHEQVKRPRNQSLLVHPLLSSIYMQHKKRLIRLKNEGKIKNDLALFVSTKTGLAISGKSYHEKFMAVKQAFLMQISREERIEDFDFLTKKRWSTHICRGVFTNFLLEIGATVTQVAIARGDKSITAVLHYVEEANAIKITQEALNKIRSAYDMEKAEITSECQEVWTKGAPT
jgi:integrase